ncbi:hypothetical protein BGX38DRAFT_1331873 [Terfezia claveryi]|nr:hypothetical protein BGX38DRAFT_1331873 [Terfezia claveryi]
MASNKRKTAPPLHDEDILPAVQRRQSTRTPRTIGSTEASTAVSDKLLRLLKVVQALPPDEYQALQHFIAVSPSTPSQTETIPVKTLTFDLILVTFGLTYSESFYAYPRFHFIDIPHAGENDVLDTSLINYSCSGPLLRFCFLYQKLFPRETEAICRIAVDQALLEAAAIISGAAEDWRNAAIPNATPEIILRTLHDTGRHTPVDLSRRVLCLAEVHVHSPVHRKQQRVRSGESNGIKEVVYTGRIDYAVALRDPETQHLTSYLILVKAKRESEFNKARAQVLGYAACIWEARKQKGARLDCTTYGLATDGFKWQLIVIDHDGVVKDGKLLDARLKGWVEVLQMLVAVLKRARQLQTPDNSSKKPKHSSLATTMHDGDVLDADKEFQEEGEEAEQEDGVPDIEH